MITAEKLEPEKNAYKLPENTKILVVDDVVDIQVVLRFFLEYRGAIVLTADNGADAIEIALKEKPSLILMDMQLPDMNGFTVTRKLRTRGFGEPIIAMTANSSPSDQELYYRSGCSDFIAKPVDWTQLLHILNKYVKGPRALMTTVLG